VGEHGGARLDNGFLVLSKIGRIGVRWPRPLEGVPKTVTISREADGWYVCISCADVPAETLHRTGRETGIDVGLKVSLIATDGSAVENPTIIARRISNSQKRSAASPAASRAATASAKLLLS
jgi:putative transposase